jgi:hypothetical protein
MCFVKRPSVVNLDLFCKQVFSFIRATVIATMLLCLLTEFTTISMLMSVDSSSYLEMERKSGMSPKKGKMNLCAQVRS